MIIKKKKYEELIAENDQLKKSLKSIPMDYKAWDEDLGFLMLVLQRKVNMTISYVVNTLSEQLRNTDYLNDDMIAPQIEDCVTETMQMLSPSYKDFLVSKYFSSTEALIKFITEDAYHKLVSASIDRNETKIKNQMIRKNLSDLGNRNTSQLKPE